MTWAVYGRGSYFAGAPAPKDVDVVVVTDQRPTRAEAVERVRPALNGAPRSLPLDLAVVPPGSLSIWERAIVHDGVHLDGDDLRPEVLPPTWVEWAYFAAWWFEDVRHSDPAAAALAAVRGALAPAVGVVALSKFLVPQVARGTPWEALATAAWEYRGERTAFDHPDLNDAGRACARACGGTAYGGPAGVVAALYRAVLDAHALRAVAATTPTEAVHAGGWRKGAWDDPHTGEALYSVAAVANECWWRRPMDGWEQTELHRHPVGSEFPRHVDRHDLVSPLMRTAYPGANLDLLRTRSMNVIGLVQAADEGGELCVWSDTGEVGTKQLGGTWAQGNGDRAVIDLRPGDVAVVDSTAPHGVTRVDAGERLVLVTHTHDDSPGADRLMRRAFPV